MSTQMIAEHLPVRRFSPGFVARTQRRYESDDFKDERIRAAYEGGPQRGAITHLASLFQWPEWAVKRRAAELGR
ncbi:MAG: hypothetical protein ACREDR_29580, partial [Blastocatellia bacterium]